MAVQNSWPSGETAHRKRRQTRIGLHARQPADNQGTIKGSHVGAAVDDRVAGAMLPLVALASPLRALGQEVGLCVAPDFRQSKPRSSILKPVFRINRSFV
jgi:hypothetical protein